MDIGLIVFVAVIGLHAGPHAVEAFQSSGRRLLRQDLRGRHDCDGRPARGGHAHRALRFKMSPLMLLGGLAGAQTCTPGLTALQGGQRQQRRLAGLHGAVRDRQHRPHDLGAGGRGHRACDARHAMKRGFEILRDKSLNRSVIFSRRERDRLGLRGLLPHRVATSRQMVDRVMTNLDRLASDIDRYVMLSDCRIATSGCSTGR